MDIAPIQAGDLIHMRDDHPIYLCVLAEGDRVIWFSTHGLSNPIYNDRGYAEELVLQGQLSRYM